MENQAQPEKHPVLGGKAYLYRRNDSQLWQAAAYLKGRNYRNSTQETQLRHAIKAAEDWYFHLLGLNSVGQLPQKKEITFREVADQFMKEYSVMTEGQRSPRWVAGHDIRLRVHLLPFFGDMPISKVTVSKAQEYRVHRMTPQTAKNPEAKDNRPHPAGRLPAPKTIHNEIVTLRQVLKTAERHGWITFVPNLSAPFRGSGKVSHRPWFSPAEYKTLYEATRDNAKNAREQDRWSAEQLHDYVLFLGNTGLRPDEVKNLQHRDVEIVKDKATDQEILVIEVRGKRGIGFCKSTAGAVLPYRRLLKRAKPLAAGQTEPSYPEQTDFLFPSNHSTMFDKLLTDNNLKRDRDGKARTSYSLRHTYICMRLLEGADIYQVAKNCRTSVEMIEKHYAAHLKNTLDAAAINVEKTGDSRAKNQKRKPKADKEKR
jgi:integrase